MLNLLSASGCECGKPHIAAIDDVAMGKGAINRLPEFIKKYQATKAFLLADVNTFAAAGEQVCALLDANTIPYSKHIYQDKHLHPDEKAVGSAVMHFDYTCDLIIGIGSGVINDIGKILSRATGRKYIIVGTAPSMDGYASDTSSMALDDLKVSVRSRCADVIIGDTDILKNAPEHLLKAGLGDMLAKYVSITEWRIGALITGEYYCEQVAELVRKALRKCVDNADGLLKRDEKAIEATFEGLIISGVTMAYAGVSRPASGTEHYFSHVWDMRGLEFGTQVDLHGIQCAWGTLQATKLYDALKKLTPNAETAKEYVKNFSYEDWKTEMRSFLGKSAETMIAQEATEQKYDKSSHPERLEKIIDHWDDILQIVNEELPTYTQMAGILDTIGIPKDMQSIGVDRENAKQTFKTTKDIRDKYVLARLAWDLGILDSLSETL